MNIKSLLLICGILAPLIFVGSDIISGLNWDGYSFASRAVSELRGIGAPTRTFLMPILFLYSLLEIAFGIGIWKVASSRIVCTIGALLIGLGILDAIGPVLVMDAGEAVGSITNSIHIAATILTVIFLVSIVVLGIFIKGKWFRSYSIFTLVMVLGGSALTFLQIPRIAANLPTPWLGLTERVSIYSYMLWLAVLAIVLLRQNTYLAKNKIQNREG